MVAASAQYEIDIQMSQQTIQALRQQGYFLYAFKAVQTAVSGGAPVIWFQTNELLTTTSITWQDEYQAYVSSNAIIANGEIYLDSMTSISPGQTAAVGSGGVMTVSTGGEPSAISILNQGMVEWACGVAQMVGEQVSPLCAVPLSANMLDAFTPVERVLLMFSTNPYSTGTVVFESPAPGVFVDLTGAAQRTIVFDTYQGWSWDGSTWASQIPSRSNLVPC
jgi:hypothetical protein